VTWYSFRHTFSTVFAEKYGRPAQKHALLDDAPDMSQRYTHPDFERVLRNAMNVHGHARRHSAGVAPADGPRRRTVAIR
jgi:hypothetical protein